VLKVQTSKNLHQNGKFFGNSLYIAFLHCKASMHECGIFVEAVLLKLQLSSDIFVEGYFDTCYNLQTLIGNGVIKNYVTIKLGQSDTSFHCKLFARKLYMVLFFKLVSNLYLPRRMPKR
jgi:hypothetical protein